jgi:hypothetical protein
MAEEKNTIRVRMLKTVANASTVWFAANEAENRDGLYEVDAEVARAWIRDGVAEAVGTGAKAVTAEAAADDEAPRASEVDPALQVQAQPVNLSGPVPTAPTPAAKGTTGGKKK